MHGLENIQIYFSIVSDIDLFISLLYGNDKFDGRKYRKLFISAIRLIKYSKRFDEQLF